LLGGAESLLRDTLAPMLLGADPTSFRLLQRQLFAASFYNGFAVGAIDIALHDLAGKALGVPAHRLYGGVLRSELSIYASLPGYDDARALEDLWLEEACEVAQQGIRGVKLRIGRFPPSREMHAIRKVREALPSEVKLMVDANAAYSMSTALHVGEELADIGVEWFEEPLPQHGYHGYPELRQKLRLPLAGGEGLQSRAGFAELLGRGGVDIVQPDVSICGGIGECLFVGELAALSAVQCIPHCWAGAVTLAATLHVVALLPDASKLPGGEPPLVEFDVTESPFRDDITGGAFTPSNGVLQVPNAPGLGVELDEAVLRRYALDS
jgi:D-galactarolactone cycloisomerase